MNNLWQYLQIAGLAVWLGGAIFFLFDLGVFSPQPLDDAPTRQSAFSLPLVGAVIVLYMMLQMAVAAAGAGIGVVPRSMLVPETSPATQPDTTTASATAPAPSQAENTVIVNGIVAVTVGLTIIPVLLILPRLFRERWSGWGLHLRQLPKGILLGLGGLLIIFPILQAFAVGLDEIYRHFLQHGMSEHATFEAMNEPLSPGGQCVLIFGAIIVAPIYEEIFFRGIIQTTLIQYGWGLVLPQWGRWGGIPTGYRPSALHRWGGILVTSAAFAGMHQWDQAPIIFILSLALGYVYERTGNLWAAIALHMAFNSMEVAAYFTSA